MHLLDFLHRKKFRVPKSRNSVHPASNGHDVFCSNRKIKELLGVETQQECHEVNELLRKSGCQDQLHEEDLSANDSTDENNEGYDVPMVKWLENQKDFSNMVSQKSMPSPLKSVWQESQKDITDLASQESMPPPLKSLQLENQKDFTDVALQKPISASHKPSTPFKSFSTKPHEECATGMPYGTGIRQKANSARGPITSNEDRRVAQMLGLIDMASLVQQLPNTNRRVKPSKLVVVKDKAEILNSRHWFGKTSDFSMRNGGKKNAVSLESFPLPPPICEKHYLPTPRARVSEEVPSVAHPLPPPSKLDGKPIARAVVSCDSPRKSCDIFDIPIQKSTTLGSFFTSSQTPPHPLAVRPQVLVNISNQPHCPSSSYRLSPRLSLPSHDQSSSHFPSQPAVHSPPHSPVTRSLCPRKWTKGTVLGQGTFGIVHEGLNLEDGSFFAVKVSSREDVSPEIQQEVDVLSQLEHPNIVRYLGSSVVDRRLCIFLELVGMGSLDSILRKYKRFEDHTIRGYTRQILLGLEYLHRKKTIHRDVKCANILVDVNGQIKLSDFGIAKQLAESLASSLKGSPLYMAPEVLRSNKGRCYGFPADIWSLGCTVLEMADGKPPWSNLKGFGFFFKVETGELPPLPDHLSPEGKDFICSCLKFNPKDRPTATELLRHPFVLNVATPEPLMNIPWSPPSPVSPIMWPPASGDSSANTWACGNWHPLSPPSHQVGRSCFNQTAQTVLQGR